MTLASFLFRSHCRSARRGFALIATITLLLLLSLISVGLLGLAASQNRTAAAAILAAEARSQALLGLDAALAELQLALGPDQRVSASSGIVGAHNANILGAWNSWDASLTDKSPAHGGDIKSTYTKGRDKMFRRWLISAVNKADIDKLGNIGSLGMRKPGKRICLVGEGTLGRGIPQQQYIYADMVEVPMASNNTGNFAWWIGGENQKAKVNIDTPETGNDVMDVQRRTWDTPAPIVSHIRGLEGGLPRGQRAKFLSTSSLTLGRRTSTDAGRSYFFDITTSSSSLPVNVRSGGFKHDLNLLLNKDSLRDTEFARLPQSDCSLFGEKTIAQGSEPDMPIGSWQIMHAWYHLWPGSAQASSSGMCSRLLGSGGNVYSTINGAATPVDGHGRTHFDNKTDFEEGKGTAGYPRSPLILSFYDTFGLYCKELKQDGDKELKYDLYITVAPLFLWWNPYNVPMKIKEESIYSNSVPYRCMFLQSFCRRGPGDNTWGPYAVAYANDSSGRNYGGFDIGNYFRESMQGTHELLFAPGEIIFFSAGQRSSDFATNKPWVSPFSVGFEPAGVSGYKCYFDYKPFASELGPSAPAGDQWYINLRLGIDKINSSEASDTPYGVSGAESRLDSLRETPGRYECVTLYGGYGGSTNQTNPHTNNDGKNMISPQSFHLGWYDPSKYDAPSTATALIPENEWWDPDQGQTNPDVPYFFACVGIAPKNAAKNLDSRLFPDKDFRTKSWLHSSPAFWGSALVNPTDEERVYHPFQLSILPISGGADSCPLDVMPNNRNGILGISSLYGGEQVSFASILELPAHPPFSLAGFAGMRLTPGWFEAGKSSNAIKRRQQYQSGVPGVGIGNSFADPCIPADAVYAYHEYRMPADSHTNSVFKDDDGELDGCLTIFNNFYDHGFLVNDALWDRFFCSSVSDMPGSGSATVKAETTLRRFFDGDSPLPVSRYRKSNDCTDTEEAVRNILAADGWKKIARYLVIDGGFNVNSVSVDAWQAVLQGLQSRALVAIENGKLKVFGQTNGEKAGSVFFSRFGTSTTSKSVDSVGGYSPLQGADFRSAGSELTAWGEVRELSPRQIRQLAKAMVEIVKKRGPFLNMADFINRRLDASDQESSLVGALQAAIDSTTINSEIFSIEAQSQSAGDLFKFPLAEKGSIHTAAPGYLIQSDVLASLGNVLTVRDDTFIVRSYGSVRNARGAVRAQAWCEAVVQRTPQYVDSANGPLDQPSSPNGTHDASRLTPLNVAFGRRFQVVSFRWLTEKDI